MVTPRTIRISLSFIFLFLVICFISSATVYADSYALDLDGSGDYIETSQTATQLGIEGNKPKTICLWVYTRAFNNGGIYDIGNHSTAQNFAIRTLTSNNVWRIEYYAYYRDYTIDSLNKWVHFAQTYDGTTARVYANGKLIDEWTLNLNITDSIPLRIGNWGGSTLNGIMDNVHLYDTALDEMDIVMDMYGTIATSLIADWEFDEGSGTVAVDPVGGFDGTLTGDPQWVVPDRVDPDAQPDLLLRTDNEQGYLGDDIYNDISGQTKTQTMGLAETAIYDIVLQNDSSAIDGITVTASPADANWDVKYILVNTQIDITAELTDMAGYEFALDGGAILPIQIQVKPTPLGIASSATKDITLTATSVIDPAKTDQVRASTTYQTGFSHPKTMTYTTSADFAGGMAVGVEYTTVPDQLQLKEQSSTFPYIWVPNSNEGTVSKVDTRTGKELGRYRTGPATNGNPSRTTVDLYGNCWVGNRNTGSAVKIGLLENGQFMDRNYNGIVETSRDVNGDGNITGSEILPWGHDECVLYEVILINNVETSNVPGLYTGAYVNNADDPGVRGIAVDANNNVWLCGHNTHQFYYVDGQTAQILKKIDVSTPGTSRHTSYGAVVDKNGILWSSGQEFKDVVRFDPSTDTYTTIELGHYSYGMGLDQYGHLFVSGWTDTRLTRIDINTGVIDWSITGKYQTRGVACTDDGDVWLANTGLDNVSRFTNDGVFITDIALPAGSNPTGVSVDDEGFVWVVNYGNGYIHKIDPDTNSIVLSKNVVNTTHYGYSDMTGTVSHSSTTRIGLWSNVFNTYTPDTQWGLVSWNSSEPKGSLVTVKIRSSNDRRNWSVWEDVTNYAAARRTPNGRYLEVQASLQSFDPTAAPILYDLSITAFPCCGDPDHPFPMGDINYDCSVDIFDFGILANNWLMQTASDID
ncbi:MAG: hypothetical protein JEZ07_11715 [Phycisphaerae bacterium]|nr:hypothetical protein [Phycisphaerae bacterium]